MKNIKAITRATSRLFFKKEKIIIVVYIILGFQQISSHCFAFLKIYLEELAYNLMPENGIILIIL